MATIQVLVIRFTCFHILFEHNRNVSRVVEHASVLVPDH